MRRVSSEGIEKNEQNDKCGRLLATFILRENENLLDNVFFSMSSNTSVTCLSWRKRFVAGTEFCPRNMKFSWIESTRHETGTKFSINVSNRVN